MSHNLPPNPSSQRGKGIIPRGVHNLERGRPRLSYGDIVCAKCRQPCDFEDSAIYTDTPPGGGVLLLRAECHGAVADITMDFEAAIRFKDQPWNTRQPIMVFEDECAMLEAGKPALPGHGMETPVSP